MLRKSGVLLTIGSGMVVAGVIALATTYQPSLQKIAPPPPATFAKAAVVRGAGLAQIGDCVACHGASYAGGSPVHTPFGTVFATNITPDPATGIGAWSLVAFRRALSKGVARDGSRLYPALPYDHFTHTSAADLDDLYAFLMTRTPVRATAPANRLIPPLGFRPLLAGWQWLFLHPGVAASDPSRSADWNRGRYLVEGLAHCGACHTPRNLLGAEEPDHAYAGGWSDGWYAPPLNASSPAARAWTPEAMYDYLRTGLSFSHAAAAGPMGAVSRELSAAPDADVRAIATYTSSLMAGAKAARVVAAAPAPDQAEAAARAHPQGAALFAGACATCHGPGAPMMLEGRPVLSIGTPLYEATPRDTMKIILQGLESPVGRSGPYMPAFGDSLTDAQVGEIAAYLRARYSDRPPWPGDLSHEAAQARKAGAS
jgi:mono/diheme cytochrome c family protein